MIVFGNSAHGHTIAASAGTTFNAGDVVIAREEEGELLGGIVYRGYTGRSICGHIAGFHPRWINKDLIWVCFHYPFVQLGCESIFGEIRSSNLKILDFSQKLGFYTVARIEGVFPGTSGDSDLIITRINRDDCRWLKIKPTGLREGV